jgi:ribonuclease J
MNQTPSSVTLYPLGGLGEIGLNCMALVSGEDMVLIDCGLMFPDDSLFGIDVVIPRFDFILANKERLAAVILTHGHEDHIGALPWLLPYVDAPIRLPPDPGQLRKNRGAQLKDFVTWYGGKEPGIEIGPSPSPSSRSATPSCSLGRASRPRREVRAHGDFKIDRNPWTPRHGPGGLFRFSESGVTLFSRIRPTWNAWSLLTEREIKGASRTLPKPPAASGHAFFQPHPAHAGNLRRWPTPPDQGGHRGRSLFSNIEIAKDLATAHPAGPECTWTICPA